MPLSEDDYKTYVSRRTGDALAEVDLEMIWTRFDHIDNLELRYNYALIEAIEFLLGSTWEDYAYSVPGGGSVSADQPFQHLLELAKRANAEITRIEGVGRSSGFTMSRMTAKSPRPSPVGTADANSIDYAGAVQPRWLPSDGT